MDRAWTSRAQHPAAVALLGLCRSSWYLRPAGESAANLSLMRLLDEQYLRKPYYGSRRMSFWLGEQGQAVNRKRVQRLMRKMGLEAIYPKPRLSRPADEGADLPVFAAGCADCSSQPGVEHRYHVRADAARLFVPDGGAGLVQPLRAGLGAVEHAGRHVLPVGVRRGAAAGDARGVQHRPGMQFTARAFTGRLEQAGIAISMDGRGRALDNAFVERLWRSVKYEEIYLKVHATAAALTAGLEEYFWFYCHERPHQALGNRTPAAVYGLAGPAPRSG